MASEVKKQLKQDAINTIKPIFNKYSATNKDNTMTKEEVLAEINNPKGNKYFNYLKNLKIIEKEKGKFYYNIENESNVKANNPIAKICTAIIVIALIFAVVCVLLGSKIQDTNKVSNKDVSFIISTDWKTYEEYNEEYGWTYYKYISLPTGTNNESTNEIDYSAYPATIGVTYDQEETGLYNSLDELKETLELYVATQSVAEEYNVNTFITEKGYEAVMATVKRISYPAEIDYYYYIYKDGKLGYISAITYNLNDEEELAQTAMDIANSFEWKK